MGKNMPKGLAPNKKISINTKNNNRHSFPKWLVSFTDFLGITDCFKAFVLYASLSHSLVIYSYQQAEQRTYVKGLLFQF